MVIRCQSIDFLYVLTLYQIPFHQRTGPTGRRDSDWHEMREVLGHWYQLQLFEFEDDRKWALEKLVAIFESDAVELPNLAGQLSKLLRTNRVAPHLLPGRQPTADASQEHGYNNKVFRNLKQTLRGHDLGKALMKFSTKSCGDHIAVQVGEDITNKFFQPLLEKERGVDPYTNIL